MSDLRRLVARMYWRGIRVEVIADVLELEPSDVSAMLFTRVLPVTA